MTAATDAAGRRTAYAYDPVDRLLGETTTDPAAPTHAVGYTYDAAGNRLTLTDSAAGATAYQYNADNELVTSTTGGQTTAFAYDASGNLLSRVAGATDRAAFTWGPGNQLLGAEVTDATGTHRATYRYDAAGDRVSRTVDGAETRYLVDASGPLSQVAEAYSPAGQTVAAYSYGAGRLLSEATPGGGRGYVLADRLGSTRLLTGAGGLALGSADYDAFGNLLRQTGDPGQFLFTGQARDGLTGLDYLRARYYDPHTGRFTSVDPLAAQVGDPSGLNRYSYANASPTNYTDPSGQSWLSELAVGMLVVSGLAGLGIAYGAYQYGHNGTVTWRGDRVMVTGGVAAGLFGGGLAVGFSRQTSDPVAGTRHATTTRHVIVGTWIGTKNPVGWGLKTYAGAAGTTTLGAWLNVARASAALSPALGTLASLGLGVPGLDFGAVATWLLTPAAVGAGSLLALSPVPFNIVWGNTTMNAPRLPANPGAYPEGTVFDGLFAQLKLGGSLGVGAAPGAYEAGLGFNSGAGWSVTAQGYGYAYPGMKGWKPAPEVSLVPYAGASWTVGFSIPWGPDELS